LRDHLLYSLANGLVARPACATDLVNSNGNGWVFSGMAQASDGAMIADCCTAAPNEANVLLPDETE
jgi:hypothetical protein